MLLFFLCAKLSNFLLRSSCFSQFGKQATKI
uniref:Uncharacterized protein n=1 Tax=Arundo donax TaxID=35708 RepID=A0A0A9G2W7_ARUDO